MFRKKLCKCGCGRQTNLITHTHRSKNQYAGDYYDWIAGHGPGKRASPENVPCGFCFCLQCREILPVSEFYRDSSRRVRKLAAYCKKCSVITGNLREKKLRRAKLGVSPEMYEQMLLSQNNVCAICDQIDLVKFKGKNRELSVDHDHENGKVRGLLCGFCNGGLGMFKDNPNLLERAVSYLKLRT